MLEQDAENQPPEHGSISDVNEESLKNPNILISPIEKPHTGQGDARHILIVEDDVSLAQLAANVLAASGYTVVSVQTGEDAVTFLGTSTPTLVVLDLELAGILNGWDVFQIVRERALIPVLLTTSSEARARHYIRTREETRDTLDHLPKPYQMQSLLTRIQRMVAKTSG